MSQDLILKYQDELFAYIRHKVVDYDSSRDILQEVLIKIHLHHRKVLKQESIKSWVYKLASNAIMDHFRKKRLAVHDVPEIPDRENDHGLDQLNEELRCCMKSFLEQLSETDREALEKTDLGGLSQKEYARMKELSYSGAKSVVQRARQKLKALYERCCDITSDRYGQVIDYSRRKPCKCS